MDKRIVNAFLWAALCGVAMHYGPVAQAQTKPVVASVTQICPSAEQIIVITGQGFGNQTGYVAQDNPHILVHDITANWNAGHWGGKMVTKLVGKLFQGGVHLARVPKGADAVTLDVSSWTDNEIVVTGFSGQFGSGTWKLLPSDKIEISVWNANTNAGPSRYISRVGMQAVGASQSPAGGPTIDSVTTIQPQQNQEIIITGSGFGSQSPYDNQDSPYIMITDNTAGWMAGYVCQAYQCPVTLNVLDWTDNEVVIGGFVGGYGTDNMQINPSDQVQIAVWNPRTGVGPAICNASVSEESTVQNEPLQSPAGETNGEAANGAESAPQGSSVGTGITSVTFFGSLDQNMGIDIKGFGFGPPPVSMPFTGLLDFHFGDNKPNGFEAGHYGDAVGLNFQSWNDNEIVIDGFAGAYGSGTWFVSPGDPVDITVNNDATGQQAQWAGTLGLGEQDQGVSFQDFYSSLSPYGQWVNTADYGMCWQPTGVSAGWRPYSNGHWVWTDYGWTWVSDYDWGWAAFHYGRWTFDSAYGWVWAPGYVWGPAWVEWRWGGGYAGWAPMPPGFHYRAGIVVGPDYHDFGVRERSWNFVSARQIGRSRYVYVERARRARLFRDTRNVTRYRFTKGRVFNGGMSRGDIERVTHRRIGSVKIVRARAVGRERVAGHRLRIYSPASFRPHVRNEREVIRQQRALQRGVISRPISPALNMRPRSVTRISPGARVAGNSRPGYRFPTRVTPFRVGGRGVVGNRRETTRRSPRVFRFHAAPSRGNPRAVRRATGKINVGRRQAAPSAHIRMPAQGHNRPRIVGKPAHNNRGPKQEKPNGKGKNKKPRK